MCLNTSQRLKTYLREKEREADPDRETAPDRVSSNESSTAALGRRALSPLDSHAAKLDGALGAEPGQLMRSETHPDSAGTFSVAAKTNSGPSFPPPPPPHTPFMSLDEGEGCDEWRGCESSLYSAQQTFFLLKLCAICSHHASTHILKHPTPSVLCILGSDIRRAMNTESDRVKPERRL